MYITAFAVPTSDANGTILASIGNRLVVGPLPTISGPGGSNPITISFSFVIPVLALPTISPVLPIQSLPTNPPAPPVIADNAEVVAAPPQRVTVQFVASSAGVTSEGEERYYELRIVSFDKDGNLKEEDEASIRLDDPRLEAIYPFDPSKLPALFGRLPADRYRIYLIEDGAERLILEFTIEQGQPIEIPEVGDVEPGDGGAAENPFLDDAAAVPSFGGDQFADIDEFAPDMADAAVESGVTSNNTTQSQRLPQEPPLVGSFAERLGNASFISHGGVVVTRGCRGLCGQRPLGKVDRSADGAFRSSPTASRAAVPNQIRTTNK